MHLPQGTTCSAAIAYRLKMDSGAMYRLGSSISHSLQQGNGSPSFYSHRENQLPDSGDRQLDLLHHGGGARSATADA